jgi:ATP-binding cassette subfamily B (MDR/TAP) protein 1
MASSPDSSGAAASSQTHFHSSSDDTHPPTGNPLPPTADVTSQQPTKPSRWSRKTQTADPKAGAVGGGDAAVALDAATSGSAAIEIEGQAKEEVKAVGFTQMFRYHTKLELVLNLIGLIAAGERAHSPFLIGRLSHLSDRPIVDSSSLPSRSCSPVAASGAAQPLMTLIFGKLTNSFVSFASGLSKLDPNNPASIQALRVAQDDLRHESALDALYLTVIGIGMFLSVYIYMGIWVYTGEKASKRLRENYLQSVLRQDPAYFGKPLPHPSLCSFTETQP